MRRLYVKLRKAYIVQKNIFALHQNYPNPFNPKTIISWQLAVGSDVDLSIYNVLGQKVTTVVAGKQKAGFHMIEWDARGVASGVYFYCLRVSEAPAGGEKFVRTRKMLLIK